MTDLSSEAQTLLSNYPRGKGRSALVPLLRRAQDRDGYITPEAIEEIASILSLSSAEVRGVASFYSMLHLEAPAEHVVSICHNIACTLNGAERVISAVERHLGIVCGEVTGDRRVKLERAECLAFCDRAPMVQVDYDRMVGPVSPAAAIELVDELPRARTRYQDSDLHRTEDSTDALARTQEPGAPEPPPLVDSIELDEAERALLHRELARREEEADKSSRPHGPEYLLHLPLEEESEDSDA